MTRMTNKKGALQPPREMNRSPASKRVVRSMVGLLPTVRIVICEAAAPAEPGPVTSVWRVDHRKVTELDGDRYFDKHPEQARQEYCSREIVDGRLEGAEQYPRYWHRGDVSPHYLSVDRPATARCEKRSENREYESGKSRDEYVEYIVHGKRPHTQLTLTLRLIWRSGKRFRHNTMACGINSLMPRIRRFSAVSRVRLAVLTIPALLLCACASAHGDDACSTPYAGVGQQLHGGRPA